MPLTNQEIREALEEAKKRRQAERYEKRAPEPVDQRKYVPKEIY